MRIIREANLIQLTFMPHLFPINCYVFEEMDTITLIDTAMSSSYKGIVKVVEELGKPLTNITLTHPHFDHIGALEELKNKLPDATISVSARDNRLLLGDQSLDLNEPQSPIKGGVPKNMKIRPDRLLLEGDKIGSLEVIATPGHTPGSISFFDRKTKTVIAGDALQTRGGIAVSGQLRVLFPFPAMATWNKEIALESVKKIHELSPNLLAVGHGDLFRHPISHLQKAMTEAEENLKKKR
ncbi:MBL fold metallo-hydrolase [Bacillus weihaiensis]|uniref:MBL fold metallo-hydrolase n=1 Tax=Bacillus weihaiensis TaxID=1547283 RepID=UPI002352E59C|nr:MBL fold metallo-hydrolase [Bacillus weihaiensis]